MRNSNTLHNFGKSIKMITELQIDITYDQILTLVKQLPINDKIKLTKELEKEGLANKFSEILASFKTNDLSLSLIDEEAEIVRQKIYERKKH